MNSLEEVLDECLLQMRREGADIETLLAHHPEHAADLSPLLRTAQAVLQTPKPKFDPVARAAGRAKFLQAVARKRRYARRQRQAMRRALRNLTSLNQTVGCVTSLSQEHLRKQP